MGIYRCDYCEKHGDSRDGDMHTVEKYGDRWPYTECGHCFDQFMDDLELTENGPIISDYPGIKAINDLPLQDLYREYGPV